MTLINQLRTVLDDFTLVRRVLNGDKEAVGHFKRRYLAKLHRLARGWPPRMYQRHGTPDELADMAFIFLTTGERRTKSVREPRGYSSHRPPLQTWLDEPSADSGFVELDAFVYCRVQGYFRDLLKQVGQHEPEHIPLSDVTLADGAAAPRYPQARSERAWEHVELRIWFDYVLLRLPPAYRKILLLRHEEECTFAEIAARLEISEPAARRKYSKSVKLFVEVLRSYFPSVYDALGGVPS